MHELYMIHFSSKMRSFNNQPSNSTSCSDNALRLLILVVCKLYWRLQVTSSISNWGDDLKGCVERGIFRRAELPLKGIEDFLLKTLVVCRPTPPHTFICGTKSGHVRTRTVTCRSPICQERFNIEQKFGRSRIPQCAPTTCPSLRWGLEVVTRWVTTYLNFVG